MRPNALIAHGKERLKNPAQAVPELGLVVAVQHRPVLQWNRYIGNTRAMLEIPARSDIVDPAEERCVVLAQRSLHFFRPPDIEAAFLSFTVRIQSAAEASLCVGHLAEHKVKGAARCDGQTVVV